MASVNKNFVVRNGLEVSTNLLYADTDTQRVGIGLTLPEAELHVIGNAIINPQLTVGTLQATANVNTVNLNVTGTSSFNNLASNTLEVASTTTLSGFLDVNNNADVSGQLSFGTISGDGSPLSGIVTQIVAGPGIEISATEDPGKGVVEISSFAPVGKTVFVTQNGDDTNSGLSEADAKRTIKAAASVALTRDTIKIYPGVYVEENPIILNELVSVEGTELRNIVVTPKFPEKDMFYVNNGCHITDLSFIGQDSRDGAAIIALEKLLGTKEDRYFDAARMIRFNLDFIAKEAVEWLHSGYSGFAGNHLEQDAAKKINENIEYIAAETVGFLTGRSAGLGGVGYIGSAGTTFIITDSNSNPTAPVNCEDDIKDVFRALANDLKANSNKRSIGAAKSYFDLDTGDFLHINASDSNGNSVAQATVDAFAFATGIATHIINNQDWSTSASAVGFGTTTFANSNEFGNRGIYQNLSYEPLPGDCDAVISTFENNVGIITNTIQDEITPGAPSGVDTIAGFTTVFGVNLDVFTDCVDDVKDIWQRIIYDATRGGNSESVNAGKAYYNITGLGTEATSFTLIPEILKNPGEVEQTIATLDHSWEIARSVVNNNCYGDLDARAAGIGVTESRYFVKNALYDNHCGIMTVFISDESETDVFVEDADIRPGDPIYFKDLIFGCDLSYRGEVGIGTTTFPSEERQTEFGGSFYGNTFCVFQLPQDDAFFAANPNTFEVLVGPSTIPHYFVNDPDAPALFTGDPQWFVTPPNAGSIEQKAIFNHTNSQVKDISIQKDVSLGCDTFYPQGVNESIAGCKNVVSTLRSLVGVVTTILNDGISNGISTSFPGNRGDGIPYSKTKRVTAATYDNVLGRAVLTIPNLNAEKGDRIEIKDLVFSCDSGGPTIEQIFPSGTYGYRFYIDQVNGDNYTLNVGVSSLPHTYVRGGYVIDRTFDVTTAPYDAATGIVTVTAPGAKIKRGDIVTIKNLTYDCDTGGQAVFPNEAVQTEFGGKFYGFDFKVVDVVTDRLYNATNAQYTHTTGVTTITVTDPGFSVAVDDLVEIRDFEFECNSGAQTTPIYPTGKFGFVFKVYEVNGNDFVINTGIGPFEHTYVSGGTVRNVTYNDGGFITQSPKSDTFTLQVGVSTIGHTHVSNTGYIIPPYSPGVGPITQGPYIRNCTNFVGKSVGMRVDGFDAEPGFENDIGVTGTMSVDSYTQYNQGGIGVSITNGAYSQLVSIFTICDDIAIFTGQGGQCDLTNSNASFGRLGLFSEGVGDYNTKSIYHTTGFVAETAEIEQDTVIVAGVGTYRPYDGQALFFGELFKRVDRLEVVDGGSGYSALVPPQVTIEDPPSDAFGITAEGSVNVDPNTGAITSIDVISDGSQYRGVPVVTIDPPPPGGTQATAQAVMAPIYYYIESATLPYNNGITGISTVVLTSLLNIELARDTPVFFNRVSLQITSSHSFEWVGAGNDINKAKPALGGVVIQENEVVQTGGGIVVYTSTDQAGNFKIGDDLTINQVTGTITGRAFSQSLLQTVTPLIIALGR